MKKTYETPKVERIEFDYSDTITASGGHNWGEYTEGYTGCHDTFTGRFLNNDPGVCNG